MKFVTATALLISFCLAGCSLGSDEGAEIAMKMVQEFKPTPADPPLAEKLRGQFANDTWSVLKTSEGLYHVTVHGSASGAPKELLFGVSINKRYVMALNRDALAFTNPM